MPFTANFSRSEKFAEADTTGRLATEQDEQVKCRLTQIFQEAKNLQRLTQRVGLRQSKTSRFDVVSRRIFEYSRQGSAYLYFISLE